MQWFKVSVHNNCSHAAQHDATVTLGHTSQGLLADPYFWLAPSNGHNKHSKREQAARCGTYPIHIVVLERHLDRVRQTVRPGASQESKQPRDRVILCRTLKSINCNNLWSK